ncbi:hypothetical protein HPB48_026184 [Haemaphysalis longicornis]|uniref:Uncharacterized protein n=1 Tax=Haemaphysalis longicornis TaxID=44386 RepID=A0A9J6H0I0_HAELO|nr:hypothetical protein HPB48_026184 [Haemaphysalis longicornis]
MSAEEAHSTAEASSGYQFVLPRKSRHYSKKLQLTGDDHSAIQSPKPGLTFISKLTKEAQIISKFNPLEIKDGLESMAPEAVLQVRPNHRLSLLVVDTRNIDSTERLLKATSIAGIPVKAYERRPTNCGMGVIKEIPICIIDADISDALLQRIPGKSARRLGEKSENVRVVSAAETAPELVTLGYTRNRVFPYIEKLRQFTRCQR